MRGLRERGGERAKEGEGEGRDVRERGGRWGEGKKVGERGGRWGRGEEGGGEERKVGERGGM